MLDRTSGPILTCLLAGLIAWGLPGALIIVTGPIGLDISALLSAAMVGTLVGAVIFAAPFMLISKRFAYRKLSSAIILGLAIQAIGNGVLIAAMRSGPDERTIFWFVIGGGLAAWFLHRELSKSEIKEA